MELDATSPVYRTGYSDGYAEALDNLRGAWIAVCDSLMNPLAELCEGLSCGD